MKRLVFIHLLLIALSCVSYAEDTSLSTSSLNAPNIVFIFSDDHATSAISAYGESRKLIETPNLELIC